MNYLSHVAWLCLGLCWPYSPKFPRSAGNRGDTVPHKSPSCLVTGLKTFEKWPQLLPSGRTLGRKCQGQAWPFRCRSFQCLTNSCSFGIFRKGSGVTQQCNPFSKVIPRSQQWHAWANRLTLESWQTWKPWLHIPHQWNGTAKSALTSFQKEQTRQDLEPRGQWSKLMSPGCYNPVVYT